MLQEIASSRFGFWIVALIMATVDASFLLKPGKFAFSISHANQVRLRISTSPFTIRNRELASSFLSFPFQLFFISDIAARKRTARETFNAPCLGSSAIHYGLLSSALRPLHCDLRVALAAAPTVWLLQQQRNKDIC
jgi:hypothetical protein